MRKNLSTTQSIKRRKVLTYGFLGGSGLVMIVLLRFAMVFPIYIPVSVLDAIALLMLMFTFTYLYRKDSANRKLTFKDAYLLNMGLGLIAAVIYAVFMLFYASYIDTSFSSRFLDYQKFRIDTIELVREFNGFNSSSTPKMLAFVTFIEVSMLCLLFSFVVSIVMHTNKFSTEKEKKI